MPALRYVTLLFLVSLGSAVFAQESIDDLFNDPDAGIVEEAPEEGIQVEELTASSGPRFSGSVSASAGASIGLVDWVPDVLAAENVEFAASYGLNSTVTLDVRPSSASRLFLSATVQTPVGTSFTVSPLTIGEFFIDYTLAETLFFRAGRQSMTWGTGQLFNPGNIISDISGSVSVRSFIPLASNGLTLVVLGKDSYFQSQDSPGVSQLGYAGSFELSSGLATFGVSAFFQIDAGLTQSAFLKSSLGGIDLSLEAVSSWTSEWSYADTDFLVASFWEPGAWGVRFLGEFLFETARASAGLGSSAALGVAATDIPGFDWNPGIRWFHAFYDGSGEVVVGIDGVVAPDVRLRIGLPINYGPDTGTYMQSKSDPANRVTALVAEITLELSW